VILSTIAILWSQQKDIPAKPKNLGGGNLVLVFGLSGEKLLILGVLAALILGPERLPEYARKLAQFIKSLKKMADGAQTQLKDELGDGYEDVDWRKLDPRQYDPRRIIREALLEDDMPTGSGLNQPKPQKRLASGEVAPFDSEAT
jgi:sec-independent protein translocase protein TatB